METVRVHYLQHVPFEGLGSMEKFFSVSGFELSCTKLYENEALPETSSFDLLIIMGGPMGVGDGDRFPWLQMEIDFVKEAVEEGKFLLGICLGAQIIAHALGAEVRKNQFKEIGWFPLTVSGSVSETFLSGVFEDGMEAFHWHGETFDIPHGAVHMASSAACTNQGFVYDDRVVALQFHLETTFDSVKVLIENCEDDIDGSDYTSSPGEMLQETGRFDGLNAVMAVLLSRFVQKIKC